MTRRILLACLAITIMSPLPAVAGFYGGGSVGTGWYESDVPVNGTVENFSENATAWKAYLGLSSESFLCVEGGYRNLGSTFTNLGGRDVSFGASGWDIEMLVRAKISIVYIFGKLGGVRVDTESSEGDRTKTGLLYGLGASVAVGPIGIRAEWEYLDVESPDSLSMGTLGVTLGF